MLFADVDSSFLIKIGFVELAKFNCQNLSVPCKVPDKLGVKVIILKAIVYHKSIAIHVHISVHRVDHLSLLKG